MDENEKERGGTIYREATVAGTRQGVFGIFKLTFPMERLSNLKPSNIALLIPKLKILDNGETECFGLEVRLEKYETLKSLIPSKMRSPIQAFELKTLRDGELKPSINSMFAIVVQAKSNPEFFYKVGPLRSLTARLTQQINFDLSLSRTVLLPSVFSNAFAPSNRSRGMKQTLTCSSIDWKILHFNVCFPRAHER
ncbi:hypothetical protein GH714_023690 [Hevea brasiliensis]|uniref:Uncharacterized protein n=1 Tax=Hevea brasiliensis TaxID=3981 RepID=A0A6A6MPB9_HEVBR|nr:hypothetical protein GH714_023690 [Hevea brasiliensis]